MTINQLKIPFMRHISSFAVVMRHCHDKKSKRTEKEPEKNHHWLEIFCNHMNNNLFCLKSPCLGLYFTP